jgi:hypothetical protein
MGAGLISVSENRMSATATATIVKSDRPAWLSDARVFYSRIEEASKDSVSVFIPPDGEVSAENPGTLRLRLRRSGRSLQVLDHQERNEGVIRSEGLVRGVRHVMRRDENPVWTLSSRSVVHKRHRLRLTNGETWTFDTPFFWWQHLTGSLAGAPRLIGHVGPSKQIWLFGIEPGRETQDVLAAVALMHRNWGRW